MELFTYTFIVTTHTHAKSQGQSLVDSEVIWEMSRRIDMTSFTTFLANVVGNYWFESVLICTGSPFTYLI